MSQSSAACVARTERLSRYCMARPTAVQTSDAVDVSKSLHDTRSLTHLKTSRPSRRGFFACATQRILVAFAVTMIMPRFKSHHPRTLRCEEVHNSDMKNQTLWDHLDVGLSVLPYDINNLRKTKGKGSMTWASHSHTPVSISSWDDFDICIRAELVKHEDAQVLDADVVAALNVITPLLFEVRTEEHVTNNTALLLRPLSDLSTFKFDTGDEFTMSNPGLVAMKKVTGTFGDYSQYDFPPNRSMVKGEYTQNMKGAVLFCFETKPVWKFNFLLNAELNAEDSTQLMIRLWEVPPNFSSTDMAGDKTPSARLAHGEEEGISPDSSGLRSNDFIQAQVWDLSHSRSVVVLLSRCWR
jgi:hypothetical protein